MCYSYIKIERKKTPLSLKGRVRSARGSTLVRSDSVHTCTTCVTLHWYPLTGINRWALTGASCAITQLHVQRHGYKGVTSHADTGKDLSLVFSL